MRILHFGAITLFLLGSLAGPAWAQQGERNKAFYVEALGSGITISLNYDFRFKPTQSGLGMRVGVGGGSVSNQNSPGGGGLVTVPVLVNYLIGERRTAFEAGAGVTMAYVTASDLDIGNGELFSDNLFAVVGSLNMGLRLQPVRNGVVFRLNWTPLIGKTGFKAGIFGVSLGYGFK
jgi:hypothetical protein